MKTTITVHCYIEVEVEAPDGTDEAELLDAASNYVENGLSPTAEESNAWADVCREEGDEIVPIDASGGFVVCDAKI